MAYTNPAITDFKTYFVRDFPYSTNISGVMDADITSAFNDANVNINQGLFGSQDSYTTGYLLLAAHFLVTNIRASSQGISGNYEWLVTSKGVGSVSESFSIPERIMNNPYLAMLSKTTYGAKYLMMILPLLSGQMFISHGGTKA